MPNSDLESLSAQEQKMVGGAVSDHGLLPYSSVTSSDTVTTEKGSKENIGIGDERNCVERSPITASKHLKGNESGKKTDRLMETVTVVLFIGFLCILLPCLFVLLSQGKTTSQPPSGDLLVGTYYSPWHSEDFHEGKYMRKKLIPPQTPVLGEYDSLDLSVISQHLEWLHDANVGLIVGSWWGPTNRDDQTLREVIMKHENLGQINIALMYESDGRLIEPERTEALTNARNDVLYMCEHYFGHPNYYEIDGKPVIFIYISRKLYRIGILEEAMLLIRSTAQKCGKNVFLVGDLSPTSPSVLFWYFDAVTTYDVYGGMGRPWGYAGYERVDNYYKKQEEWRKDALSNDCRFIPTVLPGFNDKGYRMDANHPPLSRQITERSHEGSFFHYQLKQARLQTDPFLDNLIMVNSFNEFHSDTQIEPVIGEESKHPWKYTSGLTYSGYGTLYLDILRMGTSSIAANQAFFDYLLDAPPDDPSKEVEVNILGSIPFSLAILPDIQKLSANDDVAVYLKRMADLIISKGNASNIQAVVSVGDMVNKAQVKEHQSRWNRVLFLAKDVDSHGMTFIPTCGNHDGCGIGNDRKQYGKENDYNHQFDGSWDGGYNVKNTEIFHGSYGMGVESAYYLIHQASRPVLLVMSIRYGNRNQVEQVWSDWADEVLWRHRTIPAVLISHDLQDPALPWNGLDDQKNDSHWVWPNQKLSRICQHPNIFLSIMGHRHGMERANTMIDCGDGHEINNFIFVYPHTTNHSEAAKVRFFTFRPDPERNQLSIQMNTWDVTDSESGKLVDTSDCETNKKNVSCDSYEWSPSFGRVVSDRVLPSYITLMRPDGQNGPIVSSIVGYNWRNDQVWPDEYFELPLYKTDILDREKDEFWTYLVDEILLSRLDLVLLHGRGCYDKNPGSMESLHGRGHMCPRLLKGFVDAIERAGVEDVIRVGMWDDTGMYQKARNNILGTDDDQFDVADESNWDFFWSYNIKIWFDTIPRKLWFLMDGRPVIASWNLRRWRFKNQQGNASRLLMWLKKQFKDRYAVEPFFIVDDSWVLEDSTITSTHADGVYCWTGKNDNPCEFNITSDEKAYRVVIPSFRDPGFPPGCGTECREVPRNNGSTLQTGLEARQDSKFVMLEGWTNMAESGGFYRSSEWTFPSQYINLVREYSDPEPETLLFQAEGADSFFDTTPENLGGQYADRALDVGALNDKTGWYVGWTEPGEWIEYKQVQLGCGMYRITARVACTTPSARIRFVWDSLLESVQLERSNGAFVPIHLGEIQVSTAGKYDLRIEFETDGVELDWFFIKRTTKSCS